LSKQLHIVSFDVPLPANYGGVIDVFYKIKALYELGVKIHLHCFYKDRQPQAELFNYCETVNYYPRKRKLNSILSKIPFMVQSRNNEDLIKNLNKDNYPILFEGLHCTHPLLSLNFKNRKIFVRAHNIEHNYYKGLAKSESNLTKKLFYKQESEKLKTFENILTKATYILSISPFEYNYFKSLYKNTFYLPVFHQNREVTKLTTNGNYALYIADLRISDNLKAAHFLIEVFKDLNYPLIIASSFKNKNLKISVSKFKHIKFKQIYTQNEADKLLANAHLNVMLTFQPTGIKLKLINTLFAGRFCLTNSTMVKNTGLESLCLTADNKTDFKKLVETYKKRPFCADNYSNRQALLTEFNPLKNAKKLIDLIWN